MEFLLIISWALCALFNIYALLKESTPEDREETLYFSIMMCSFVPLVQLVIFGTIVWVYIEEYVNKIKEINN